MNHAERESSARQLIRRHQESVGAILDQLQGRGHMLQGSVYTRRRRCGKPECRCVRGRLHQDRVLGIRRAGRVVVRCLDAVEDTATEEAALAWRLFRRRRHDLAATCRALLRTVDRLGRLRQATPEGLR